MNSSSLSKVATALLLLSACSSPQTQPLPQFKHEAAPFLQQQKELLQADDFEVTTSTKEAGGHQISQLSIQVVNAQALPTPTDSSAAGVKRVARRVVAELSKPNDYQVVQVGFKQEKGLITKKTTQQLSFTYPLAALQ